MFEEQCKSNVNLSKVTLSHSCHSPFLLFATCFQSIAAAIPLSTVLLTRTTWSPTISFTELPNNLDIQGICLPGLNIYV